MEEDLKGYLNLLKTDFSMKANLSEKEPQIIKKWDENNIYERILEKNKDAEEKILHDGPPYANGNIHLGHALNKILKDIVVKYYLLQGYNSPYVPGWDCHGLPIELKVKKEKETDDIVNFRKECRKYAQKYIEIQRDEFKRLGCIGDWNDPYKTMDNDYEADILEVFNEIFKSGHIYTGRKPIHWCFSCETALADAEVEYSEKTSPSIYVKFPILEKEKEDEYLVIWTTTPWTIPANLAVAVHNNFEYSYVKTEKGTLIIAKDLVEKALNDMGVSDHSIIKTVKGNELLDIKYQHPLLDKVCPVISGDHVTLEDGTGLVHTAPGHGAEDYMMGKKYGLDIFSPLDDSGKYTEEYPEFKGANVFEANPGIIDKLSEKGLLLAQKSIKHSYPHCWRCHKPLIFRATDQWFIDTLDNTIKELIMKESGNVKWIPKWGETRFKNMIENRTDWCISRQRNWGVPIPSIVCGNCKEEFIDENLNTVLIGLFRKYSSDIWFEKPLNEMGVSLKCPKCGGTELEKGKNILDVWFDSGISWYAVAKKKMNKKIPVELYLEGSDQYRGWFQSSMWPAAMVNSSAPYKTVITHGFSLDENGRPMSKSLGNVISPMEIVNTLGAEILRLWVSSIDYTEDFRFSEKIVKQMVDSYKNIRNRMRFILMNISDLDPTKDAVDHDELEFIDKWALFELYQFINKIDKAYSEYEFHRIYHNVIDFTTVTMSSLYFDMIKSRLYTDPPRSKKRRSAQTVLHHMLTFFIQRLAPILSFTCEEVGNIIFPSSGSVFLHNWDELPEKWRTDTDFDKLFTLREAVQKEMEKLRSIGEIGLSLDVKLSLKIGDEELYSKLNKMDIHEFFIVSQAEVSFHDNLDKEWEISVCKSSGDKCPRCWTYNDEFTERGVCKKCSEQMDNWKKED